ncbi:CDP-glycerol glycerophosphotransferase, TagB/SpsB family [Thermosyntropha lipolytica DSM 11003]|uniref:CDP-glycerol glycerophosphotransferase, TagB/SpsB family n=1 Tax=Thermosyntropha lipolytica DSM 11003 TaxID=1123382 RepID=A0A1M5RLZ8_9FIRM|nr:CDP-glycerol glycerophosphotransferase family protein [Thermosyntropha lipolytica]SHH27377.1 CDP-glycerol glycerophosphotransferase, TagB/SpsB family [Thermosyntropha lipolytica DSM 11003]
MDFVSKLDILSDYLEDESYKEIIEIIKQEITNVSEIKVDKKERQILACFPGENGDPALDKHLWEQLEIAGQILVNKGFSIFAYAENTQESKVKEWVEVFKDEAVKYIDNEDKKHILNLIALSEIGIILNRKVLLYYILMNKPFVYCGKDVLLLERLGLKELCLDIEDKFNAGKILDKIAYIRENYGKIEDRIKQVWKNSIPDRINEPVNEKRLNSHESADGEKKTNTSDELASYKKQFKKNIELLIEHGYLEQAKQLVAEYEKIVPDDIDVYSIKGVIAMMEGDLDEAERVLKEGRDKDYLNGDILFNLAYLYEVLGQNAVAKFFYKHAYHIYKVKEQNEKCEMIFKRLNGDVQFKVLIASCIRQKEKILEQFLMSIEDLDKEGIKVYYFFVDDNDETNSKRKLQIFSEKYPETIIYTANDKKDSYVCDDNTHYWKEQLIWRVADFKDEIINYAKKREFDYVFLIDSDLVLNPKTLKHLIATGRDIISEIFWTKWYPNSFMLPQVWLKDVYIQYEISRQETIDEWELTRRHEKFLNMLKKPGVYEVGGLGACTLISIYAMKKGISFKEIKNLSFWGEDRHFCVRAMALGLKLFVDTNYPAYHIYREVDLEGIPNYRLGKFNFDKRKIALVYTNLSGSNTIALYKMMPKKIRDKYDISIIQQNMSANFYSTILSSDLAIFTEGNYPFIKKFHINRPIVIDLWHGFPIKAMGYSDNGEKFKEALEQRWKNVDYITSYSHLFNKLMNKCIYINESKYVITGAQRNDFLFYTKGKKNLEFIYSESYDGKNIIFYMPTYRYNGNRLEGNKKWVNLFDFKRFNINEFSNFLEDNNCLLFVKLHPAEERYFINNIQQNKNIKLLTNELLFKHGIDLYEIINAANILITDYSSVFFDVLLLDIPVIFTPTDIEKYKHDRGFLLPYEEWTPGPKCYDQKHLQEEIERFLKCKEYYKEKRKDILKNVHLYIDGNSCNRTWDFIEKILD